MRAPAPTRWRRCGRRATSRVSASTCRGCRLSSARMASTAPPVRPPPMKGLRSPTRPGTPTTTCPASTFAPGRSSCSATGAPCWRRCAMPSRGRSATGIRAGRSSFAWSWPACTSRPTTSSAPPRSPTRSMPAPPGLEHEAGQAFSDMVRAPLACVGLGDLDRARSIFSERLAVASHPDTRSWLGEVQNQSRPRRGGSRGGRLGGSSRACCASPRAGERLGRAHLSRARRRAPHRRGGRAAALGCRRGACARGPRGGLMVLEAPLAEWRVCASVAGLLQRRRRTRDAAALWARSARVIEMLASSLDAAPALPAHLPGQRADPRGARPRLRAGPGPQGRRPPCGGGGKGVIRFHVPPGALK